MILKIVYICSYDFCQTTDQIYHATQECGSESQGDSIQPVNCFAEFPSTEIAVLYDTEKYQIYTSFIYLINELHEVSAWFPHREPRQQVPLLDTFWQREPDLGVVELLDKRASTVGCLHLLHLDDLDRVCSGPVASPHVPVALSHCPRHAEVTVLTVHVVSTRPRVITQPDAKVLDLHRGFLWNLEIRKQNGCCIQL